jgi:hypothetical protein
MVANPGFWTRPERMPYIRINSWPAVVCQQIGYNCFLRVRHVRHLGPTVKLFLEITISAMGLLIACTEKLGSTQSIRTSCSLAQGFLTILLEKGDSQNVRRRLPPWPHRCTRVHMCTCAKARLQISKDSRSSSLKENKGGLKVLGNPMYGFASSSVNSGNGSSLCALLQHAEATKP